MSSAEALREFVKQRLTAAGDEIFALFTTTIVEYEEEVGRQRRLLEMVWRAGTDLPQQHICEEEEVLADQERNSSLDQEDSELPQIKEEEEELFTSQEGELVLKRDPDIIMLTVTDEDNDQSEDQTEDLTVTVNQRLTAAAEEIVAVFTKTIIKYKEEINHQRKLLDIVRKPEIKLHRIELPQQHVCEDEEVFADQQVWNQKNSSLHQDDQEPPQIKEEMEEVCTSQEGEFVLKQDPDMFMLSPVDDENDQGEDEAVDLNPVDSGEINPGKTSFKCDTCGKIYKYQFAFQKHLKTHTDQNPNVGETRGNDLGISCELTGHENIGYYEDEPYFCNMCGTRFADRGALRVHKRTHADEKPCLCNVCGSRFTNSSTLKVHMRKHTGEKPYLCNTCGTRFSDRSALTVHMRKHTGEKPYLCNTCGTRFTHLNALKVHSRKHTGEKPYLCNTCGTRFRNSSTLKAHMRTHTGEKPYLCNMCGSRFTQSSTLTVHMRTHTGEKPYLCNTCGTRFITNNDLTVHMRTHTDERPYVCQSCGMAFKQTSHLSLHMTRIHSG